MKRSIVILVTVSSLALIGLMLWWFQPWRLVTQSVVVEPLPTSIPSETGLTESQEPSQTQEETPSPEPTLDESRSTQPRVLLEGELISHEHSTSGVVQVLQLEDGKRVLRLEGFKTSDGPDLEVWLSDAPVIEGYEGWFLADDGAFFSLGKLKGTMGNQNYIIPSEVDLESFNSISIWCVRFAVSFGAAELVEATR